MASNPSYIDFSELNTSLPGEDLEGLTRRIGAIKGLAPTWTGRGVDQGKDLTFTEQRKGVIGDTNIKWVVSCKDHATSGSAVGESDLPHDIRAKLEQHRAQGFLLVTTTSPSTNAKTLMDSLDIRNGGSIHTEVWDRVKLREILLEDGSKELIKAFLPESYKRLCGLTTLPGALEAFKDDLPPQLFERISALVAPYAGDNVDASLSGFMIWPREETVALLIDEIVTAMSNRVDAGEVAGMCDGLPPEAFVALLYALQKQDDFKLKPRPVALAVLRPDRPEVLAYNSAQFLADNENMRYALTYAELLQIFGDDDTPHPADLAWSTIEDVVEAQAYKDHDDIQSKLNTLGHFTKFEGVTFHKGSVDLVGNDLIIKCDCTVTFLASSDADTEGSLKSLAGTLFATFDAFGVLVGHVTIDTSSWLEGEADETWINERLEEDENDGLRGPNYVLPENFEAFEFDLDDPFIGD